MTLGAADARYQHGWLLLQNENPRTITLIRGAERREISYGGWPKGSRDTVFRDMTLLEDGRLAVSVSAALPLGEQANAILLFDPARPTAPPEARSTESVLCYQLAEAAKQLWCLGPDFAELVRSSNYGLLHQITPHGVTPVVERKHLPQRGGKSPWLPAPVGEAALLTVGADTLLAWLPNAGQIVSLTPDGMRLYDLPLDASRRGSVSVAASEHGRIYALLPLPGGEEESLTTPYGLFALNRLGGDRWSRVTGSLALKRGTRILAVEGGEAVLLDRMRRLKRMRVE